LSDVTFDGRLAKASSVLNGEKIFELC
jgi:hypothetical protein